MSFLSGFVAILGPPNVGKSTLLNRIFGKKLAIVTPKPQTTRNRVIGVHHGEGYQIVFMDTPGIHKTRNPLHLSMVASALAAAKEVDILLPMIQLERPDDPESLGLMDRLKPVKKPCLLVINKIDLKPREVLLAIMDRYRSIYSFDGIIPISALTGEGVTTLLEEIKRLLTPGPQFFPEDMETDQPESLFVCEIIREKIYGFTRDEVPYSCAVTLTKLEEDPKKNLVSIWARIHVETGSQKGILIGRAGNKIRAIGRSARLELEKIFAMRVFLDLTVTVDKNWSRDGRSLRRLGY
jgi:GTP-binding protein Era